MADEAGDRESEAFSLATSSSHASTRTPSPALGEPSTATAEASPEAICQVCLKLGNEVWDPGYRERYSLGDYVPHRMPAGDVAISAQQGCAGCEIIAWALAPYMDESKELGTEVHIKFGTSHDASADRYFSRDLCYHKNFGPADKSNLPEIPVITELTIKSTSDALLKGALQEGVSPLPEYPSHPWRHLKSMPTMTNDTGSSAAVDKVRTWYSKCLSDHRDCLQDSTSVLPTRIIHIEGPGKVRLRHSGGGEHAEYVCLSYRWGNGSPIRTMWNTLETFRVGIPWNHLPKTFQHAIHFAYSLGFQYLWIDSFCIIQDDKEDWTREGSQMSKIYSNASMTLSATWADEPDQGCFASLDTRYIPRTRAFVDPNFGTYELQCHELLSQLQAPLLQRGWVFQERMLSKRIVYFMEQELWWECRELFLCECGSGTHNQSRFGVNISCTDELRDFVSIEKTQEIWERIVQIYTTKSLTFQEDIFRALRGLASLVPSAMGQYLAGHWYKSLIRSLCWYVDAAVMTRPVGRYVSSWSWAATGGAVQWPYSWLATAITEHVTMVSGERVHTSYYLGETFFCSIILRGKYLSGRIQERPHDLDPGTEYDLLFGGPQGHTISAEGASDLNWDCAPSDKDGKEVIALRVYDAEYPDPQRQTRTRQYWLILEAMEDPKNIYQRIGSFQVWSEDETGSDVRGLDAIYQEEATDMNIEIW